MELFIYSYKTKHMKKFKIIFIFFFLFNLKGWAQNSLSGKITDKKTHEPLMGVGVYIADLKTSTLSDKDGNYKLDNLPNLQVLIHITFIGYSGIIQNIDLSTTSVKDFELDESITEMNEVVVTGTSHSGELKKNPVPMVLIDQQYITQNSSTNIIETLNKVPGVSTLSTGPNVSKPYIRGLGYNRVLTLFDGVRQEGQQWGDEHGIEIDQFLIDRIEIIKGPASLMYGSDALAGVVNMMQANTLPEGKIKGNLLTNYLSNNKQVAGSFNIDGNYKGLVWGIRSSHKQAADYQNKYDGRVFGTKYNENDLNGYMGLRKSWGYSQLNLGMYNNLQEIPTGSRDSITRKFTKQISEIDTARTIVNNRELNNYTIAVLHQHIQHYRAFSSNRFYLGKSKLDVNVGYQESIRREFSHPLYPDLPGLYLKLNTITYDVKYHFREMSGWAASIGVNGMYQQNENKGTEFVIPDYHSLDIGYFAVIKKSLKKLDISAGARYDIRTFKNYSMFTKANPSTGFDMITADNTNDTSISKQFELYKHAFSGISASIGLTYNANSHFGLKANVASGYRAPNASEISAKGVHPGTGFEQLGDKDFKPEFSLQEDIGIFFNSKHVSGSVDVFNNIISNYIYNENLMSVTGGDSLFIKNGNSFPVFKFRQTTAQLYGGEFSIDIHPHPLDYLHFQNTLSYIYAVNLGGNGARITDSTKNLPLIPPLHTNTELRADIKKKVGCFTTIFLKIGIQYYAAQNNFYAAYGTETKTPAYTLLDAGIGTNVVNKKGTILFNLTILGNNLANIAYQSNMNRLKYFDNYPNNTTGKSGIYNMGRNISVRLVIPLDFTKGKV